MVHCELTDDEIGSISRVCLLLLHENLNLTEILEEMQIQCRGENDEFIQVSPRQIGC